MAKHKAEHKEERIAASSAVEVNEIENNMTLKVAWIAILALLFYLLAYNKIKSGEGEDENAQTEVSAPDFDMVNWFDGYYQDKTEEYLKNDSRLGKTLLPLKNQLDYKAFHKVSLVVYTVGKKDYFICTTAIDAYLGRHALPDSTVNEQLRKAKVLQDTLKQKGIDLVFVFVPTKEYFMPNEIVPAKYLQYPRHTNNYEKYVTGCKALGLNYMDFYSYFNSIRDKAPYPLYTQHGTHMSYYAECLAADTVIKYIEHLKGIELPHIAWNDVTTSDEPKVRDGDVIGKCKLTQVAPELKPLAYPNIGYTGSPNAHPIHVLGVGDSYYRAFMYLGVTDNAFDHGEYWYYNSTVNPETPDKKEAWEYDLKSTIESYKAIVIMYCSNNLYMYGNGFIEDAYEMYTNPAAYNARVQKEKPIKLAKKKIHNDADLMEEVQKRSNKEHISLDSAISLKAMEMVHNR